MSIAVPPLFGEPVETFAAPPPAGAIAGFWRRLGAFLLDGLIVGIAAFIITIPFFSQLSKLGAYGRILGLIMALPYYAILNSRIGNGQTIGKRILHIQVVDASAVTLPFAKSLIRYLVLAIPYFLYASALPVTRTPWILSTALSALGIITAATLYLVLYNRNTRQGIHDLAASSFVVSSDLAGPPDEKPIWKGHWVILTTIVIVFLVSSKLIGMKISKWRAFPQLLEDARLLENLESVQSAQVMEQWSATLGKGESKKSLVLTIHWGGDSSDNEAVADRLAKIILTHDSSVQNFDSLRIVIVRGYDLGIAEATSTNTFAHSPNEWRARLSGSSISDETSPKKL